MDEVELFQIAFFSVVRAAADVRGDALGLEAYREVFARSNESTLANRVLALAPGVYEPLADEERASILSRAFENAQGLVRTYLDEYELDDQLFEPPTREEIEAALREELEALEAGTLVQMDIDRDQWASNCEPVPEYY